MNAMSRTCTADENAPATLPCDVCFVRELHLIPEADTSGISVGMPIYNSWGGIWEPRVLVSATPGSAVEYDEPAASGDPEQER